MPLAVFSDIHGNLPALEAVLADIEGLGIEDVVCLGDVVGYGPQPDEVVSLLRRRAIPTLRGNLEEAVLGRAPADAKPATVAAAAWAKSRISDSNREWLGRLPLERRLVLHGRSLLLTHASPGNPWRGVVPEAPADGLREALAGARCDVLLVGHLHTRFVRDVGRGILACPGSAGYSYDGPEAQLLLVDAAGAFDGDEPSGKTRMPRGARGGGLDFAERDVAYDVGAMLDETLKAGLTVESLPERARPWLPSRK